MKLLTHTNVHGNKQYVSRTHVWILSRGWNGSGN